MGAEIFAGILGVVIAVTIAVVKLRTKKKATTDQDLRDEKRANEILTKSVTRPPERVRKLDDAGFRD